MSIRAGILLALVASGGLGFTTIHGGLDQADGRASTQSPSWFADNTVAANLNFTLRPATASSYFMPNLTAGGAALFDFDNDQRLDILLLQNAGPTSRFTNRLFRQTVRGTFEDVSDGSGLDVSGYGQGVAAGDVDNDGWVDIAITEYGATRLFMNRRDGRFVEVTRRVTIDNPLWGTSACFVDYDRDGWLDLAVANYVEYDPTKPCRHKSGRPDFCGPDAFPGTVSKLFRNRGRFRPAAEPRFEDMTMKSGIGRTSGPGLGIVCLDFDGDHWPDIFVANDGQPNRLWMNKQNGTFRDEAVERGVAYNAMGQLQAHMGVAVGDVDSDGLFDLFVTHLTEETHTLWKQGPRGHFQDVTAAAKLTAAASRSTGFGAVFADFDSDGDQDLAFANGRVALGSKVASPGTSFWQAYAERNLLFANDGTGRFVDVSVQNVPFSGSTAVSRGLAVGDIDNDGAPDLLVTAIDGPARLFRNVAARRGHWLTVRAFDPRLKRDAYGSEITVTAGARRWVQWVNPAHSYVSSSDPRAHFGLGAATRVDMIDVVWPDGARESFPGQSVDRIIELRKGAGKRQ